MAAVPDLEDGQTILVRGEGGAESLLDVPPSGSFRREHFTEFVQSGRLTIVDVAPKVDDDGQLVADKPTGRRRQAKA